MNDQSDIGGMTQSGSDRAENFLRLIERSRRGRLKVYLGYGPGVGKTYRMLQEAHALAERGIDVVIGYVENHERSETQRLVKGLETVPPRSVLYRGIDLLEMDIDAVIERNATVTLVDELAHTNAPGSRNEKRYQDVLELLDKGMHVITTLNVQHLESLFDTVHRLIGVNVNERLPDWVLEEADEVVNVDLSTEDLQQRMQSGKVYPSDRVDASLRNFFQRENLEHLRNLTLRQIASHIEGRSRSDPLSPTVSAPDQVVVCLSSRGPDSPTLLRYGSRLAGRLNRTWYALYVQTPSEESQRVDAETQRHISDTLALAHRLGATVMWRKGDDVPATILRFANEYGIGHVVIGRPTPAPFLRRLIGQKPIVDRLIDHADGKVIVVVDTMSARTPSAPKRPPSGDASGTISAPSHRRSPTASMHESDSQFEDAAPAATIAELPASPAPAPPGDIRISKFIEPGRIIVWHEPVTSKQAISQLMTRMILSEPDLGYGETLRAIEAREAEGSTFLDAGIAVPHARVHGLQQPMFGLGLPRAGVIDRDTASPISMVWLYLIPEIGFAGFMPSGQLTRMFRSPEFMRQIAGADVPADVFAAIQEWEDRNLTPG